MVQDNKTQTAISKITLASQPTNHRHPQDIIKYSCEQPLAVSKPAGQTI